MAESIQHYGDISTEIHASSLKISSYLLLHLPEEVFVIPAIWKIAQKLRFDFFTFVPRQTAAQKPIISGGKAEITPFGLKNRIFYRVICSFLHCILSLLSHFESHLTPKI